MLAEPTVTLASLHGISATRCLIKPNQGKSVFRLINPTDVSITLEEGTVIGKANTVPTPCVTLVSEVNSGNISHHNKHQAQNSKDLAIDLSNADLTASEKSDLLQFLGRYRDVFATNQSQS